MAGRKKTIGTGRKATPKANVVGKVIKAKGGSKSGSGKTRTKGTGGSISVGQVASVKVDGTQIDIGKRYRNVVQLLGGRQVIKREIRSKLDVHNVVTVGISGRAIIHMLKNTQLRQQDVAPALGMSVRTAQRLEAGKALTDEQSGRAWKFAEVLEQACEVFGTREQAERWMNAPAPALNRRTPIELMSTVAGTELVEQLLGRLRYGVYT